MHAEPTVPLEQHAIYAPERGARSPFGHSRDHALENVQIRGLQKAGTNITARSRTMPTAGTTSGNIGDARGLTGPNAGRCAKKRRDAQRPAGLASTSMGTRTTRSGEMETLAAGRIDGGRSNIPITVPLE